MKLNMFQSWKPLGKMSGHVLEYRSEKVGNNSFVTVIRDQKSQNIVTKGYSKDKESSQQAAFTNLKRAGTEKVLAAIESGQSIGQEVEPKRVEPRGDIEWRDGAHQSNRAMKKTIGEDFEIELDEETKDIFD